jgi:hypothetical protein
MESIQREIDAIDQMENSIPKIFGLKSEKLQNALMHGRLIIYFIKELFGYILTRTGIPSRYRRNRSYGIIGNYHVIELSAYKKGTNFGMFYKKRMF